MRKKDYKYYRLNKKNEIITVKFAQAMIYTNRLSNAKILYRDVYKGYEYLVVSYGDHPCCYVGLYENDKYYKESYLVIDLDVHGGLTYSGSLSHIDDIDHDLWWIGWDYAHYGDYIGILPTSTNCHKWKTSELIKDCIDAINKIEVM